MSGWLRVAVFACLQLASVGASANCSVVAGNPPATPDSRFARSEPVAGQPVVHDLTTGLVWQGCEAGRSGATCADGAAVDVDWAGALQLAAAATYAGFDDWRLPNALELASLVETACVAPMINTTLFPVDLGASVWTATARARPAVSAHDQAFAVDFASGLRSSVAKSTLQRVRLVRGGGLAAFDSGRDYIPADITLPALLARPRAVPLEFGPVTVDGIDTPIGVAVSGGGSPAYSINGGAFTSEPGLLRAGDQLRVRHTSAGSAATTTRSTLRVGPLQIEARSVTASDDASLASLAIDGVALVPAFQTGTLAYSAALANAQASIRVIAALASPGATLRIAGEAIASGVQSAPIAMLPGSNVVDIDILAEDGSTSRRYTIAVQRALATSTLGLSSSAPAVLPGTPLTLTATVTGDAPGGNVRFLASGSEIAGCGARPLSVMAPHTATCAVPGLAAGAVTLRADYAGDANNLPSSGELVVTVNTPPTLSVAATASLDEDATVPLLIELADAETPVDALQLVVSAADPALLDGAALATSITGSGALRSMALSARPDAFGRGLLVLAVQDPQGGRSEASIDVEVLAVNDPPSALVLRQVLHPLGSAGAQAREQAATSLAVGPANESDQTLAFSVSELSDPQDLVSDAAIDGSGRLTYQLSGRSGVARLAVAPIDDGGVARGGRNQGATSIVRIFVGPGSDVETRVVRVAPTGADLPQAIVEGTSHGEYRLQVVNHGPDRVPALRVSALASRGLTEALWQCEAPAECLPSNGTGPLQLVTPIDPDGVVTMALSGRYLPLQFALELQVAATAAPGVLVGTDDDRKVLLEPLHPSIIFLSGFD